MIPRVLKWISLLVLLLVLLALVFSVYTYRQVRLAAIADEARPADAIVVLGAAQYNGRPSPVFKARLDHAYDLYDRGLARAVITTGSYGPDPNFSEAHVGTLYLIQRGIDEDHIVTEQGSGTTRDSIRAVVTLMESKSWKSALVVSDGFHLYRVKLMLEDSGVVAYTSPVPNSLIETSSAQRFWYSIREIVLVSAYRLINL